MAALISMLLDLPRAALVALFPLVVYLPTSVGKQARTVLTLLLHLTPALDPAADPLVTDFRAPKCTSYDHGDRSRDAVLITGATGFVGTHLISHLLRSEPDIHIFCVVRSKSSGKILREAARLQLAMPDFEARTTILSGDCKLGNLGLAPETWKDLGGRVRHVFHLAANSSFVVPFDVLRKQWMPSFLGLIAWCAANSVAFHAVGSVGRFAVTPPKYRRMRGVRDAPPPSRGHKYRPGGRHDGR